MTLLPDPVKQFYGWNKLLVEMMVFKDASSSSNQTWREITHSTNWWKALVTQLNNGGKEVLRE